ncbi:uncharacterized protein LOC132195276 [Neocloeon triangulifer]|uniref:uncharacterized protein LOC132195276 n=1 Tax=Neocloeon triangulifer TaxID=2078957 RepID=UPI00286EEDB0|nr:uncharacterized protein LOC132195276 [Neocloeon triangulifer]
MKFSIRALILLIVAVATVHCYGPQPRPSRPMRRGPPPLHNRHSIVSRRDPAYIPGPPYSKRPMRNMMVTRPKKHINPSLMGHYSKFSPVYKYPPPPQSRPYSVGPPKKSFYNSRPYGSPSKYPYYAKHPGYPSKPVRPSKMPFEEYPRETVATFVNPKQTSSKGTPTLSYKPGVKVPTITYGSPSIAKPYNHYGSSEESGESSEEIQSTHHVGASIKYGKTNPASRPAHPSILDPEVNIKFPGPSFSSNYKTINVQPGQETQHHTETSGVHYPSITTDTVSSSPKRRRPQRQDASKATQATSSKPYSNSNVKFPAASSQSETAATSYQNYDHFLQETFAPDLTKQAETYSATKQQKRDRSKSRYRTPAKHYEVKDEPEERDDSYDDIETVDTDYEGWQPSDSK